MSAITPQTSMPADSSSPSGMLTTSSRFVRLQASCSAGSADLYLIQKNEGGKWFKTGKVLRLDSSVEEKATDQLIVENLTPTTAYHVLQERGGTVTAYIAGQDSTTSVTTLSATTLSASGNGSIGGDLAVTGNETVGGTLGVTGAVTMSAAASVGTTLAVTGATTLTGQLNANGGAQLKGSAPSAAADAVMLGVADINGATTGALKKVYEGGGTITERMSSTSGALKVMHYNESVTDDSTITLPVPASGHTGILIIGALVDGGILTVQNDGTVTKLAGSTNLVTTDTDAKLVVWSDSGTPKIKNRLGSTVVITAEYRWS